MPALKAADLTGRTLGDVVTVEIRDPETKKLRYVTGKLVEWRGVHGQHEGATDATTLFMGKVQTPDGNGGAQVLFGAEDVLYTNPEIAEEVTISELDFQRIEDEVNGN